ncbi:MAG: TonB-dependent receptor plug domain-containing protein, partial [Bacteroidota bacterium]
GVQSVGEGTTGFNVRGGNNDQNLILLDHAPIFNPSHLMGFFSAFNAEVIRDFELHKSVIPAEMGGRLSSVMELNVKNGNKKRFSGSAGISPLTGKFYLEGPVIKEKFSFLLGGRSTYSNWLLKRIDNEEIKRSQASFYDVNAKLDYDINNKHNLSLSGYFSHDDFYKNNKDTLFLHTNSSGSMKWRYKINPSLIKNTRFIYSNYNNSITDVSSPQRAYRVGYNIDYYEYRSDFIFFLNNRHLLNFGISTNYYHLLPGKMEAIGNESIIIPQTIAQEQGNETAVYISDEFKISSRLTVNAGLRYSLYSFLGPGRVYSYAEGLPTDISTLRDTLNYKKFQAINSYHGPEPRISMRYILGKQLSMKIGYSKMRQNVHIMSNTFSVSPTDTWKLSDPNLGPQIADQVSLGVYKNFGGGMIETSVETYYKKIKGLKDYKVAATLMMNDHIETEIINCDGKAYGAELLIRKPSGKLNGWLSYTYSRILQQSQGEFREEKINNNEWFPAIYDKPHSFSLVANYRFSRRVSMSSNLVYSTGRPITYPVAKYNFRNGRFLHYSNRNEYRVDDYFRWDMSFNLDGNLRTDQISHSFWSFSVYNITGRDNVYSIYFVSGGESVQGYKMSVFAEPILSISYNLRF